MPTIKVSKKDVKIKLGANSVYPELEKISVKSKPNEQLIKPTKYGFSEITVEPLDIKLQSKEIEPSTEIQEIIADEEYDALNKVVVKQVTYKIDENIKPENIKNGVSILDVQGNVIELVGEEKTVKFRKSLNFADNKIELIAYTISKY